MKKILSIIIIAVFLAAFSAGCTIRIYYVRVYKNPDSTVTFDLDIDADVPHSTTVDADGTLDIDPNLIP